MTDSACARSATRSVLTNEDKGKFSGVPEELIVSPKNTIASRDKFIGENLVMNYNGF